MSHWVEETKKHSLSFIWTINAEHVDLDMHFIFVFLNGFASHHPSEKIVNLVDLPNWIIVEVEER